MACTMTQLLHVASSGRQAASVSLRAAERVITDLAPDQVTLRDVTKGSLPFVGTDWAPTHDGTADDMAKFAISDTLIQEVLAADTILISAPMYNFGVPASLKAWIDLICRPLITFEYLPDGPIGLLEGKKGIIVMAAGGVPVDGVEDFATPHLRQVFDFIGITDVTTFAAKDIIK